MIYLSKALLVVLITLPLSLLLVFVGPFDRKGKLADRISRLWTWSVLKIGGVRLKVQGLDCLDQGQQYIFVANHQSNIDIPVLVQSLARFQLRWLAKRELLSIPFFGWAIRASRHIIVDRSNRSKALASLKEATEKIAGGISVVIFPEGTRSLDGKLLPFKRGGFLLAMKTETPIVPITINGSGAILPRGDWRIRGGEIEVIVSEPVPVERYDPRSLRNLLDRVRITIESHSRRRAGSSGDSSRGDQTRGLTVAVAEEE